MIWLRIFLAGRKLQRITDKRRNSFEIVDYRKRREAALRGRANALRAPRSHASHSKPAAFRPSGFDHISQGGK